MRWIVLLFCGLLASVDIASAADSPLAPLKPGEVLRGRFTQERQLQGFARPLRSEGSFVLVEGKGLIWRSEKPFANETIITAAGILQMVGGTETMRLSAARVPFLNRFYDVLSGSLSGDWAPVERDFEMVRHGDGAAWDITLTPRNADNPALGGLSSITVHGASFVDRVEIRKAGGDEDRLVFLEQSRALGGLSEGDTKLLDSASR